jgi:hypothetical protein
MEGPRALARRPAGCEAPGSKERGVARHRTDGFKSPPGGWAEGEEDDVYRLSIEFGDLDAFLGSKPWLACADLHELVGGNSAQFDTFVKDRVLIPTGLPWERASGGGARLTMRLDTWSSEATWRALEPVLGDLGWLRARRRAGRLRRTVWEMHFRPRDRRPRFESHAQWTLALSACDVRQRDRKALSGLFEQLYHRAAEAECVGGRANRVERNRRLRDTRFDGFWSTGHSRTDECFECADSHRRPCVPYISSVNLLSPAHVEQLNDPELLSGLARQADAEGTTHADLVVRALPKGRLAVVLAEQLCVDRRAWGIPQQRPDLMSDDNARVLHIAMQRRGMIHGFDDAEYEELFDRCVRGIQREEVIDTPGPGRAIARTAVADIIAHLRENPPRCLNGHGRLLDLNTVADDAAAWRTLQVGYELDRATTLYGVRQPTEPTFTSPILAGATSPSRATLRFDLGEHGFDGEQLERRLPARPRRLTQFVCAECQGRIFRITADFEFDITEWGLGTDAMADRPQDFFTWLNIRVACVACKWTGEAASIECA